MLHYLSPALPLQAPDRMQTESSERIEQIARCARHSSSAKRWVDHRRGTACLSS